MLDFWESRKLVRKSSDIHDPIFRKLVQKRDPAAWEMKVLQISDSQSK